MQYKLTVKRLKRFILVCIGFIFLFFLCENILSRKIESVIQNEIPKDFLLDYTSFRFNLLSRSIELKDLSFRTDTSSVTKDTFFRIDSKMVRASGIGFSSLIKKNTIKVRSLELYSPKTQIMQRPEELKSKKKSNMNFPYVSIEEFRVFDAGGKETDPRTGDILWKVPKYSVEIDQLELPEGPIINPSFDTLSLKINAEDIFMKLNEFDTLHIDNLALLKNDLNAENLKIKTKYDKETLSKILNKERDHFDLTIKNFQVSNITMPLENEKRAFFADSIDIKTLECTVYRDKTLPNDTLPKKNYTEMLEDLSFPIHLLHTSVSSSSLSYLEKTREEVEPQPILFTDIQGTFSNISNLDQQEIKIILNAQLMDSSPITLEMETKTGNPEGNFMVAGKAFNFNATKINPFLKTNMGIASKGWVDELFFTFSGNKQRAAGDMKMKYEDFEFKVLKKDLLSIRKTTSFLVNLLVKGGSKTDQGSFRHGKIEASPEIDKSFINYIWICIRSGLLNTVTGNGKKKA
ncbi:hypothetical protein [Ascidiimonas aurantiaca]|uniref:hypothetical protein n=1 Tax=Ascidiimonas aurantiaca TaxID=1685432 RepID=UPI0030EC8F6D